MFTSIPIATPRWAGGAVPQLNREALPSDLVFYAIPRGNCFLDLVSGTPSRFASYLTPVPTTETIVATNGTATPVAMASGIFNSVGTYALGHVWDARTGLDSLTTDGSVFALATIVTSTGTKYHPIVGSFESGGATSKSFWLMIDDNGNAGPGRVIAMIGAASSSPNATACPSNALTSDPKNILHFFGMGWDATDTTAYYQGNKTQTMLTRSVTAATTRNTVALSTGWINGATAYYGWAAVLMGFNRKLRVEEYNRLWQNPWAGIK